MDEYGSCTTPGSLSLVLHLESVSSVQNTKQAKLLNPPQVSCSASLDPQQTLGNEAQVLLCLKLPGCYEGDHTGIGSMDLNVW